MSTRLPVEKPGHVCEVVSNVDDGDGDEVAVVGRRGPTFVMLAAAASCCHT